MKVYHGTIKQSADNIIRNGIDLSKSKDRLDFGKGFYTTPNLEYAVNTAFSKNIKAKNQRFEERFIGAVLEFEYDIEFDMRIMSFDCRSLNWGQFIINNRNGYEYISSIKYKNHNLDNKYDIVIGAIADGGIVLISDNLLILNDAMSYSELDNIKYKMETMQISFHTLKSLDCMKYIRYGIINLQKGVEWYE